MKSNNTPEVGKFGWSGFPCPQSKKTFSIKIFPWIKRIINHGWFASEGIGEGKVIYRIRGYCNNPQAVYDRADEIVDDLNGEFYGNELEAKKLIKERKSETVKGKP